ncbi:hypothetical protein [Absidia glauca]|uniref:LIM zinc-binding domain-containing protein n=1 Tax=Absidia glauca TaxID=4829 RepID=A0A168SXM7_ABSGL|nr:hypothetical protein [Absidia glauca]
MPYCQRCGELGRSDKCQKCGNRLLSNTSAALLWKKRDSVSPIITPTSTITYQPPETVPCKKCHRPLSGKTVQLPDDDDDESGISKTYHWSCLQCVKCSQPFQTPSFYLDSNQHMYHTECVVPSPEDDNPDKTCDTCQSTILDKYLNIGTSLFHPKCFRCIGCQGVLTSASIYCYKDQTQTYCSPCHHIHFPQDQNIINNNVQWHIVPQVRSIFRQLTFDIRMSSSGPFGRVRKQFPGIVGVLYAALVVKPSTLLPKSRPPAVNALFLHAQHVW